MSQMKFKCRERWKFTWLPLFGPSFVYWFQWVKVVEDRRVDENGREVWQLVSVNGRLV